MSVSSSSRGILAPEHSEQNAIIEATEGVDPMTQTW